MQETSTLDRSRLMSVLWDIQKKKRCIEPEDISKIAQAFDMSKIELEGIISFFHFYHLTDVGKHTVYLNNSIVSELEGRDDVRKAFEEAVGVRFGNVTADKMFGLFETACIGLSDQEPSCLINLKPFTNLTRQKVFDIVEQLRAGKPPSSICDTPRSVIRYTPSPERTVFFKSYPRFSALEHLKRHTPDEIIEILKQSKLAGYGGAFFPAGLKWQLCRQNPGDTKYIICNADEGEPGTFKDRVLLEEHPELMIEGMIFAAYAIGARHGAIYLRAEYSHLQKKLESLLEIYRKDGFLGSGISAREPFDFDIYVHLGAGAYVCGEETALIHSMEGKRGEPGTKEYFPVQKGFKGKPTVVNNVETLCAVPRIFEMGVENWLKLGTEKTPGTKVLSVSGDCSKKGIYEIEWGMNFGEFLKLAGAEEARMVQLSGPSGDCYSITQSAADAAPVADLRPEARLCGEDIRCGGSVMIFNRDRDILHILKSFSDFFVAESCGICVPCRTGNFLLNRRLQKLINGHGERRDLNDVIAWSRIIRTTSRCGLGQMSNNTLLQAVEKFPEVFDKALAENADFSRAFKLDEATAEYDRIIQEVNASYE
ncbi:MAG: NAD(P)H-dependent oxidoreductase subunit E [Acidobacteria bacterium]|nr:NAD(P)H-dependent oxidoreductase subunit E [Acidobacteriota bacterium]